MNVSMKSLCSLAVAALAVATLAASGEENEAKSLGFESDSPAPASSGSASGGGNAGKPAAPPKKKNFRIGEEVALGDFSVKVNKVIDPYTSNNQFMKPKPGTRHVVVDVTVKNNSAKPASVSSLLCFDLRDGDGRTSEFAITDAPGGSVDGEVAPGSKITGNASYAVLKDAKDLKLLFKCDLLSRGSAEISLTK